MRGEVVAAIKGHIVHFFLTGRESEREWQFKKGREGTSEGG